MSETHEDVAAEVRAALARRRLSGRQAALKLGWTTPYISRRLTGRVAFDVSDLAKLAKLLNLPITAFFDSPVAGIGSGNLRFSTPLRAA